MFTKESNYNPRFCEKKSRQWEIFNNYKEKLSYPRVHTAVLSLKPGLHISRKDRKHMIANTFLNLSRYVLVFT